MFFFKTRDYEKYREWEVQGVSIEGLIFYNLEEMKNMVKNLRIRRFKIKVQMGKRVVIKPSKL